MSDYWSGNITEAVQNAQKVVEEGYKEQLEKETAKADSDAERSRERIFQGQETHNMFVGSVLENILDNFDNHSYNLKLYMIPPGEGNISTDSQTGDPKQSTESDDSDSDGAREDIPERGDFNSTGKGYLNDCVRAEPENTVVLAQTGVTEVGIDNLEITTVPGPNSTETSTVNFTITQPNAADFPDQIVKGRQFLGAPPDAGDCPLFLEINFVGYDESDAETDIDNGIAGNNSAAFDVEKGGTPRLIYGPIIFPLILKNFSMNITAGGSVYNFETVVQNDITGADNFFRLQKAMTIKGSNIAEMLGDLQNQVNAWNKKKTGEESDEVEDPPYQTIFGISNFLYDNHKKRGTMDKLKVAGLDIEDQSLDIDAAEKVARILTDDLTGEKRRQSEAQRKEAADRKKQRDDFNRSIGMPVDPEPDPNDPSTWTTPGVLDTFTGLKENGYDLTTIPSVLPVKNKIQVEPEAIEKITIDLDVGLTYMEILGIILSMNLEFMQKASRTKDINDPTNKEVDTTKQVMWYTLDASVKYGKWDEKRREYKKTAFFYPRTYLSDKSDIAVFPWELEACNNLSKEDTTTRVQQMNVRKAYEYIFTGRNDQIKNVDITYNEGLALLLPTERGTLGDISLNAKNILTSDPIPKNEELEDGGLEKLKKAKGKGSFFDQLKDLIKKGNNIVENIGRAANLTNEEIRDLISDANGKSAEKLQGILSDQTNAQAVADQLTKNRKTSSQEGATTESDEFSPSESGFVYGGDLIGDNKYTEQLQENVANQNTPTYNMTKPPLRGNQQAKDGIANVGTYKGIKNNLFTYLYSQNVAVDFLMRLEMTVRGDPWWLGRRPQPPGENKQISGMSADKNRASAGDDLICAQTDNVNYLCFSLNSPRLFDPNVEDEDKNTGMWMKEGDGTSYFMSGIYQVKDVVHRFSNGVYDCDITSVKEVAIDLSNTERLSGNFVYTDTERKSRSSRQQDGTLTESEIESNFNQDDVAFVNGFLTTAGDGRDTNPFDDEYTGELVEGMPAGYERGSFRYKDYKVRKMLKLGKINADQYRAWYQSEKLKEDKRQQRDSERQKQEKQRKKDYNTAGG